MQASNATECAGPNAAAVLLFTLSQQMALLVIDEILYSKKGQPRLWSARAGRARHAEGTQREGSQHSEPDSDGL